MKFFDRKKNVFLTNFTKHKISWQIICCLRKHNHIIYFNIEKYLVIIYKQIINMYLNLVLKKFYIYNKIKRY